MSETDLCDGELFHSGEKENGDGDACVDLMFSKQLLNAKCVKNATESSTRSSGNWCEAVSSSLSNVTGKQAWKSGTEKFSQTLNNVRTTFGVLSQKLKKSTKKRQALINAQSPSSPVTPYAKSRAALGRTPTKLYSPFSIDTPTGKENRYITDKTQSENSNIKERKKKFRSTKLDLDGDVGETKTGKAVLSNELLQTQIGIYEFHSVASRIVQRGLNK